MEEAKQHVNEAKLRSSSVHPEESGKTGSEKEKKPKDKRSWKSSLISWWGADKKSKLRAEPTNNSHSQSKVYAKRQGHVSGPIYNCGIVPEVKHWRPKSGPLTSLFKSTNGEESNIPYMSLHHQQQNSPRAVHNYGPLYVVT